MAKEAVTVSDDLPVGHDYQESRKNRPGKPAFEKAPPDACAIRPVTVKLTGLPPFEGELQGNLEHVRLIAGKYRHFFGSLCEWVEVEGEKV